MRATNWEMVQRLTRSTCAGGFVNSGEHDCATPVTGKGLATVVALGRHWRFAGRSPELRAGSGKSGEVWRRQRGRQPSTGVGFYSRGAGVVTGGRGRAGFAHGRALSAPPVVSPRRTRGSSLLPWFNGGFEHHSVRILAKSLCTVASLLHILPFCCEFQVKIWSG
jgi:hypothetical protein